MNILFVIRSPTQALALRKAMTELATR